MESTTIEGRKGSGALPITGNGSGPGGHRAQHNHPASRSPGALRASGPRGQRAEEDGRQGQAAEQAGEAPVLLLARRGDPGGAGGRAEATDRGRGGWTPSWQRAPSPGIATSPGASDLGKGDADPRKRDGRGSKTAPEKSGAWGQNTRVPWARCALKRVCPTLSKLEPFVGCESFLGVPSRHACRNFLVAKLRAFGQEEPTAQRTERRAGPSGQCCQRFQAGGPPIVYGTSANQTADRAGGSSPLSSTAA